MAQKEENTFTSWELTDEEKSLILEDHSNFQKYVGYNTSYYMDEKENFKTDINNLKSMESWDLYYKNPNKIQIDFKKIKEREIFGILENPFWN